MSTETKAVQHTPGPWAPDSMRHGRHGCIEIRSALGGMVATCYAPAYDKNPITPADCEANARLIAAGPEMYKAICELECPDCGHTLEHHADKYNCDVERGDGYRIGSEILEALGPCGCECLECPDLLALIAAIRKVKGASL